MAVILLGQLDMQLRTCPLAKQLITSIGQGFRGNDESTNQRLRPCICENKNTKIALCDSRKFNPAKLKACTVYVHMYAQYMYVHIYVCTIHVHIQYVYVYVCVCMYVCMNCSFCEFSSPKCVLHSGESDRVGVQSCASIAALPLHGKMLLDIGRPQSWRRGVSHRLHFTYTHTYAQLWMTQ